MTAKVKLRISNHRAYVWDVQDLITLRSQHHICGLLVGTLPHLSQQNVFLGVPLILMPEEVVFLVTKELAVLVDDPSAHHSPSLEELQKWKEARDREVKESVSRIEETQQISATRRAMSDEAIKKRKEREEKRTAARARLMADASAAEGSNNQAPNLSSFAVPESTAEVAESTTTTTTAPIAYAVIIPALSTELSWYDSSAHSYDTIALAKEAGIWSYPENLHERAKCGVFRDLWEKGCFMGGGLRFGGDFLVYPGDPLRYHSHFVASVIDSPTSVMSPMEIVAHGRLGTATKKSHLLCGWDDTTGAVSYHSIEWAGFG